ncbi:hypothetical protein CO612_02885 [Lysobacteraceae bacterium NML71-0210]|nr:hypothetical protein CO612_02885 [Xanthomonadaceae bacterium NML71-0210]
MSCHILFSRTHLPSAEDWQAMAASLPGDLQIDTDIDTASFEGWLPCLLGQGAETGFEYWLDALSLEEGSDWQGIQPEWDACLALENTDWDSHRAALIAAVAWAMVVHGGVVDEDRNTLICGETKLRAWLSTQLAGLDAMQAQEQQHEARLAHLGLQDLPAELDTALASLLGQRVLLRYQPMMGFLELVHPQQPPQWHLFARAWQAEYGELKFDGSRDARLQQQQLQNGLQAPDSEQDFERWQRARAQAEAADQQDSERLAALLAKHEHWVVEQAHRNGQEGLHFVLGPEPVLQVRWLSLASGLSFRHDGLLWSMNAFQKLAVS